MALTKEQILEKVRTIVVDQLGVEPDEVMPETKLVDDLGADDLDLLEIIMALEGEFEIEIPDEDGPEEKFQTVDGIVDYLHQKLK